MLPNTSGPNALLYSAANEGERRLSKRGFALFDTSCDCRVSKDAISVERSNQT